MTEKARTFPPEDAVLTVTLYRADPGCIEYGFKVEGTAEEGSPLHVEQLNILADIITRSLEEAEKTLIRKSLLSDRETRKAREDYWVKFHQKAEGIPN